MIAARPAEDRFAVQGSESREWVVLAISGALIAAIFALDKMMPLGNTGAMLYIIPVTVALWSPLRRTKYLVAVISTLLTIIVIPMKPPGEDPIFIFNRSAHLLALWALVLVSDIYIVSRDRAECALRESEERFRNMADNISQLAWMADGTGSIFWYNKRWYDYTGTDPEVMKGVGWHEVQHPDHFDRVTGKMTRCFESGEFWEDTFPLRSKDGHYQWFLGRAVPIKNDSMVVRWFGTATDITKELEIKKDLEASNTELRQFAYVASHDLQEPLRTMTTYLTLIDRRIGGHLDDETRQYFEFAIEGGQRARELVRNLLDYTRIDSQGKPFEPIDMKQIMKKVCENLKVRTQELKASVTVEDMPVVMADEGQMVILLQNLVSNAIKFHGLDAPKVHISAREDGRGWVFGVRDNGIGIDPQYGEKIFMIFQRLHTNDEFEGTGIGLAICKKIVERHGGRIWFESEAGKGTTFFFIIPKEGA